MKKIIAVIAALAAVLGLAFGCAGGGTGKLKVYASFYTVYDAVAKIGGDKVEAVNLLPTGGDGHHWEPSSAEVASLLRADAFFYSGEGMEHWVEDFLDMDDAKNLFTVQTSAGMQLITKDGGSHNSDHEHDGDDGDDHEHDDDHVHSENGDPHVWLSPANYKIMLANVRDALSQADTDNADYYAENYEHYAAQADALHQEFLQGLDGYVKRDIVVSHRAYGYLCRDYTLTQHSVSGLTTESEPSPAAMAEIVRLIDEKGIRVIFFEGPASEAVAQTLAAETDIEIAFLSPLESLTQAQAAAGGDYFSVMRQNLAAIKSALEQLNAVQ